jgi:hypothetical protein
MRECFRCSIGFLGIDIKGQPQLGFNPVDKVLLVHVECVLRAIDVNFIFEKQCEFGSTTIILTSRSLRIFTKTKRKPAAER